MYGVLVLYVRTSLSGESASGQEAPPTVPRLLNLDLDNREERVPSESDVQDILSSAHAPQSQVLGQTITVFFLYVTLEIHTLVSNLHISIISLRFEVS